MTLSEVFYGSSWDPTHDLYWDVTNVGKAVKQTQKFHLKNSETSLKKCCHIQN